jgi:hypothetical protein
MSLNYNNKRAILWLQKDLLILSTLRNEGIYMAGLNRGLVTGKEDFFKETGRLPKRTRQYIEKRSLKTLVQASY